MLKSNGGLIFVFLLISSCATKKKIDPKTKFPTDYGFTFQLPFKGDWYQGKADFYLFGTGPESDGSSTLAEVRHGPIFESDEYHRPDPKTLKDVFEPSLRRKTPQDKVDIHKTEVLYRPFKNTACLFFKQVGNERSTKLKLNYNGIVCLHPRDGNKYIWMAVSQRKPADKPFENLTAQEMAFFESLTFERLEE